MTPSITEVMTWNFEEGKPQDYVWLDLGEAFSAEEIDKVLAQTDGIDFFQTRIEDLPMPFEKFGIVYKDYSMFIRDTTGLHACTFERTLDSDVKMTLVFRGNLKDGLTVKSMGDVVIENSNTKFRWSEKLVLAGLEKNYTKVKSLGEFFHKLPEEKQLEYAELIFNQENVVYRILIDRLINKKQTVRAVQATPNPANTKRISKGKKPLFEWKVIDVVAKNEVVNPRTGRSHASPRQHKRIGHIRRLRTGKTTWVRESMVGKITFGYVHHSYATSVTKQ